MIYPQKKMSRGLRLLLVGLHLERPGRDVVISPRAHALFAEPRFVISAADFAVRVLWACAV